MLNIKRKYYFRILSFILILTTSFLPLLANNLPSIIRSYRFIWAPFWLLSLLLFEPKIFLNRQIFYLLIYGLVFVQILLNTIWLGMREWDRNMVRDEYYVFVVTLSIIWYYRIEKDYIGLAVLSKWSLIFIVITAIMTIYSSIIDPLYARNITGGSYNLSQEEYFSKLGGGTYGYSGALIGLFPIMVYYYRNEKISIFSRGYILIFGTLCFIALIRMQIFANILMAFIAIVLSLLGSKRIKFSLTLIVLLAIILFFIPRFFYSEVLIKISHYFNPHSETFYKLNDMANFIVTGDIEGTGAGDRVSRYPLLFYAFMTNPLLGYYATNHEIDIGAGGHLYWMNKLTIFGLTGFIPYLLIHIFYLKTSLKYFNREYSFYYLISVFSIISLGLMKNLDGREMWFVYFVLLQAFYYLPLLKKRTLLKPG
jgi:hypothetical protein